MHIEDLKGRVTVDCEGDLVRRLRSVRKGGYGAFVLSRDDKEPSLWICINKDVAYLHFFRNNSGKHPGFQPTGMSPTPGDGLIHFLQTTGTEGDSIDVPTTTLVSVDIAYKAAIEFLHQPTLPPSVSWFEL